MCYNLKLVYVSISDVSLFTEGFLSLMFLEGVSIFQEGVQMFPEDVWKFQEGGCLDVQEGVWMFPEGIWISQRVFQIINYLIINLKLYFFKPVA